MAAPTCRVLGCAEPACSRRADDPFDPATHPAGRLGDAGPDRIENGPNVLGADLVHRQVTKWLAIDLERHPPLGPMFRVFPARLHRRDQRISNRCKGSRGHFVFACRCFLIAERISACGKLRSCLCCLLPGLHKRHCRHAAKAHLAQLLGSSISVQEDPALCRVLVDDKIEAPAVGRACPWSATS